MSCRFPRTSKFDLLTLLAARGLVVLAIPAALGSAAGAAEGTAPTPEPAAPVSARNTAAEPLPRPVPSGQMSTKFSIDYWDPEKSVPSAKDRDNNPLEFGYFIQDLLEKAETARKANDLKAVVRFYRAVAKAVPDNAKGWSKLCEAYELVKDRERAIRACKYAMERPAVELQDYARYVRLVLAKDGTLSPAEVSDLNSVFTHIEKQGSLDFQVAEFRCEMGLKLKDVGILEACTKAMSRLAPDDAQTVVFQWSLAMEKGQRAEAERQIERAVKAGVVIDSIVRMQRVTSSLAGRGRVVIKVVVATAIMMLILAAAFLVMRRRTLTQRPG